MSPNARLDRTGSERITTCLSALLAPQDRKASGGTEVGGINRCAKMPVRGQIAGPAVVTVQPASIVRIDDAEERRCVFEGFVDDLGGC